MYPTRRWKSSGWGEMGIWQHHTTSHTLSGMHSIYSQTAAEKSVKWGQRADVCLWKKTNELAAAADSDWLIYSNAKRNTNCPGALSNRGDAKTSTANWAERPMPQRNWKDTKSSIGCSSSEILFWKWRWTSSPWQDGRWY